MFSNSHHFERGPSPLLAATMGVSLSKLNNKCSFDFDAYIGEREELAEDLRRISQDAASHRQVKGSWQMVHGASGVAAGIAGGVALVAAPVTFGMSLPIVATTAMIVGNSITAASLASSAATYGYGHVVDKDIAKRLQNLRHVIESITCKDVEINSFLKAPTSSNTSASNSADKSKQETAKESKSLSNNKGEPNKKGSSEKLTEMKTSTKESCKKNVSHNASTKKSNTQKVSTASEKAASDTAAGSKVSKKASVSPVTTTKKGKKSVAIKACQTLCEVWNEWDLATKENKTVGFDLAVALVKSQGILMGTHSMIQGSKQVTEEQDLETALVNMADLIDKESLLIRQLDLRYLSCIPTERRLSRARLMHIDGGGGQVTMIVTFHRGFFRGYLSPEETLKSDSTNSIRLPEGATNITVQFTDRTGKVVKKVDRSAPQQPWVKSEDGKHHEVEACTFDIGDGVDAVFVVKGCLTHAYIHTAWDFGRISEPRSWEWWENVHEESKELLPDIEQRSRVARSTAIHNDAPCGLDFCGPSDVSGYNPASVA